MIIVKKIGRFIDTLQHVTTDKTSWLFEICSKKTVVEIGPNLKKIYPEGELIHMKGGKSERENRECVVVCERDRERKRVRKSVCV